MHVTLRRGVGVRFVLLLQILSLMMEIESAFRLIFNLESKW